MEWGVLGDALGWSGREAVIEKYPAMSQAEMFFSIATTESPGKLYMAFGVESREKKTS